MAVSVSVSVKIQVEEPTLDSLRTFYEEALTQECTWDEFLSNVFAMGCGMFGAMAAEELTKAMAMAGAVPDP